MNSRRDDTILFGRHGFEIRVRHVGNPGLNIAGYSPRPPQDDFTAILPKLQDPAVGGLIFGSPSYFRGLSSLCKAFIERCAPLREPKMLLVDKPVGVVALGQFRNGGQELVIEQIQAAMVDWFSVRPQTRASIVEVEIGVPCGSRTRLWGPLPELLGQRDF